MHDHAIESRSALLELAARLGNVSAACRAAGYSRDSFYRYRELRTHGTLEQRTERRGRPILKNRLAPEAEREVVMIALHEPDIGRVAVAKRLRRKGFKISAGGVRKVWARHGLETSQKRRLAGARREVLSPEARLRKKWGINRLVAAKYGREPHRR